MVLKDALREVSENLVAVPYEVAADVLDDPMLIPPKVLSSLYTTQSTILSPQEAEFFIKLRSFRDNIKKHKVNLNELYAEFEDSFMNSGDLPFKLYESGYMLTDILPKKINKFLINEQENHKQLIEDDYISKAGELTEKSLDIFSPPTEPHPAFCEDTSGGWDFPILSKIANYFSNKKEQKNLESTLEEAGAEHKVPRFWKKHPTLTKIAAVFAAGSTAGVTYFALSTDDGNISKANEKNTDESGLKYLGPCEFNINKYGDSIKVDSAEDLDGKLVLKFEARDVLDKSDKPERTNYTLIISEDDAGTYVQSENWGTEADRGILVYDNLNYLDYKHVFLYPAGETNRGDTLNSLEGELYKDINGNYIIKDPSRISLYDGQLLGVGANDQEINGIVVDVTDIYAGAKWVKYRPLNSPFQVLDLYFFGNRIYTVNDELVTTDQLEFGRGDVIQIQGREITQVGQEYGGPSDINEGDIAVIEHSKITG